MIAADSLLNPPPTRPDVTRAVCRGASRHLRALGYAVVKEMTFANGRRGDIVALSPSGELLVIEVKSGIEDYRVDGKWPDYRDFCDGFLFAVAPEFPVEILPENVGLIVADAYGGAAARCTTPCAGAGASQGVDHRLRPAGRRAAGGARRPAAGVRRDPARRSDQRGARLARMRCSVRRCMPSRRAVSETLRLQSS